MKVCIILPKGLPVPATMGGAIETLMNHIVDVNEREHKMDITVVSTFNSEAYKASKKYKYSNYIYINPNSLGYKLESLRVHILNLFGKHLNTYNEQALRRIKNIKYDRILVEDGSFHSFESYLKYFKKDQMILHFHHVGNSDDHTDNTYSRFIGVSDYVLKTFKHTSGINDLNVLRNGIDINKFSKNISAKERDSIRTNLGFKKDDFVVVYCGRIIKEKGVLELIQAINKIDNDKIKLMIIGSTNFGTNSKNSYLDIINKLVLESNGRIKTTGFIDNKEVYKYYKISDIGVIPSICEDAAPLVVVENMASGLPLIVTLSGGAPEYATEDTIVVAKDDFISTNIKNAIEKLYSDSALRDKMSKSGLKKAKEFTLENFYHNLIKILEK